MAVDGTLDGLGPSAAGANVRFNVKRFLTLFGVLALLALVSIGAPAQPAHTGTCAAEVVDGWFEPTQGVYQDDPDLSDRSGKQLTRIPGTAMPTYDAELGMITSRDTALTGVDHYRENGKLVQIPAALRRDFIVMKIRTNCTARVPVRFRFTAAGGGVKPNPIALSEVVDRIPLEPPARHLPKKDWPVYTVRLNAKLGIPLATPFSFTQPGTYRLWADLVQQNGMPFSPRLAVEVEGRSANRAGFSALVVPVFLHTATEAQQTNAERAAERIARETRMHLPDYFPLPNRDSIRVMIASPEDFSRNEIMRLKVGSHGERIEMSMADTLAMEAIHLNAGRVVEVMRPDDMQQLFDAAAYAETSKVIAVTTGTDHWTVAHELAHTVNYLWSEKEMVAQCGKDYHNEAGETPHWKFAKDRANAQAADEEGPANGLQITWLGKNDRVAHDRAVPIMGLDNPNIWIDQCTYAHLYAGLANRLDPRITFVRGFLYKTKTGYGGSFQPFYDAEGAVTLHPGMQGDFALVVRAHGGAELARYRFTPEWRREDEKHSNKLTSFDYTIPELPKQAASVELVAPNGTIAKISVSPTQPHVKFMHSTIESGKAILRWSGMGTAPLRYSLYATDDGGTHWTSVLRESSITTAALRTQPRRHYLVRLFATDGTRSTMSDLRLR
jgi:hypothetical protein